MRFSLQGESEEKWYHGQQLVFRKNLYTQVVPEGGLFCVIGNFVPITQKAPRGRALRGEEFNASHTARARKCAAGAHFIY